MEVYEFKARRIKYAIRACAANRVFLQDRIGYLLNIRSDDPRTMCAGVGMRASAIRPEAGASRASARRLHRDEHEPQGRACGRAALSRVRGGELCGICAHGPPHPGVPPRGPAFCGADVLGALLPELVHAPPDRHLAHVEDRGHHQIRAEIVEHRAGLSGARPTTTVPADAASNQRHVMGGGGSRERVGVARPAGEREDAVPEVPGVVPVRVARVSDASTELETVKS